MDNQTIDNALVFLGRTDLKGYEALQFIKVVNALKSMKAEEHTIQDHFRAVEKEDRTIQQDHFRAVEKEV